MQTRATVCVVDDDESACRTTCNILENSGDLSCRGYTSPERFLMEVDEVMPSCIVMDVRMPKMDGIELQQRLQARRQRSVPIIVLTGYADVPTAVVLMKHGAETLIEKPYEPNDLIVRVRAAVAKQLEEAPRLENALLTKQRYDSLTDEEREILDLMVTGAPNKTIVAKLALSPRTLDRRRSHILHHMGAETVPELATLIGRMNAELNPDVI